MAKVAEEEGAIIHTSKGVKKLLIQNRAVKGLLLEIGEEISADEVILNADFGYAVTNLVKLGLLKKYNKQKLDKKSFSCFYIYVVY